MPILTASINFKDEIEVLIKRRRDLYLNHPEHIFKDFNEENRLKGDYADRQILELLQNADDVKSPEVLLHLDRTRRYLVVANKGNAPFSAGGIQSLMLPGFSTKVKRSFIGNKGLGFRSVLNWAYKIEIITQGWCITFSQETAEEEYNKLSAQNAEIGQLKAERDFKESAIPFPILAIPRMTRNSDGAADGWATYIKLYYHQKEEKSIIDQLNNFSDRVLIFLKNINTITIAGIETEKHIVAIKEVEGKVTIGKNTWWLYTTGELLLPGHLQDPNRSDKEYYQVSLAYSEGLSSSSDKLFNFFPTDITLSLPYIVHGTFDLDSSRKHIISPSLKNDFVFGELAKLIKKLTLEWTQRKEEASWIPWRLLTPINSASDSPEIKALYQSLITFRNDTKILPCLDGKYRLPTDIVFYRNDFSQWLVDISKAHCLPEHLLYCEHKNFLDSDLFKSKKYRLPELKERIDNLSHEIDNLQDRKDLIDFLLYGEFMPYPQERFALMVDENMDVIFSDNIAYTPVMESENIFYRPSFIKFAFMNKELYTLLLVQHRSKFTGDEQESRRFKAYFEKLVNIQPYDSNSAISKVMSGTREQRNKVTGLENEKQVVKEMVQELFKTYQLLKNPQEQFSDSCLLITKSGEIKDSNALWLNNSFPSGALTEELYYGIFNASDYVADPESFGLMSTDSHLLERFFLWLGVNKFVKFSELEYTVYEDNWDEYISFCYEKYPWTDTTTKYLFKGIKIDEAERTIRKLSREKLLLLVMKEDKILRRLSPDNEDSLISTHYNRRNIFGKKPSYINYQLESMDKFAGYLVENEGVPELNTVNFEVSDGIYRKYGIKPEEIKYALYRLGAKMSFNELGADVVYNYIRSCGQNEWKHEHARKLYQMCFNYFKANTSISFDAASKDLFLLARQNGDVAYKPAKDVYYSDNKTLPDKILNQYWTFDFPKRNGEEQIARFFGVKNYKEVIFRIKEYKTKHPGLQTKFDEWFTQIKPYILATRLQTLQAADEKRNAANVLKRCQIKLFSSLIYTTSDNEDQTLEIDEFVIIEREEYVICIGDKTSLEDLQRTPQFCDSIAEIFCILFKVNEGKNSYRSIFKDSLSETKHLIKQDSLSDMLSQAQTLLGIPRIEYFFWKNIFSHLGKSTHYPDDVPDQKTLMKLIHTNLEIALPASYQSLDLENIDSENAVEFLKLIVDKTRISEKDLLQFDDFKVSLYNWYSGQLRDRILIRKTCFRKLLHASLVNKSDDEKGQFINLLFEYDDKISSHCIEQIAGNEFSLNLKIDLLVAAATSEIYRLNLNDCQGDLSIIKGYESLCRNFNIDENELPSEVRSLLFFEGFEEKLNKMFAEIASSDQPSNEPVTLDQPEFIEVNEIKASPLSDRSHPNTGGDKKWKHNKNSDKVKKTTGKQSEILVRNALINRYPDGNVEWISGYSDTPDNTDSLHYDIRYIDNSGILRYVEVKTFNNSSFILTGAEREFAMQNKLRYDIALVTGNKVQYIKNFFSLPDDEAFERNGLFSARPKDFEIGLEIEIVE